MPASNTPYTARGRPRRSMAFPNTVLPSARPAIYAARTVAMANAEPPNTLVRSRDHTTSYMSALAPDTKKSPRARNSAGVMALFWGVGRLDSETVLGLVMAMGWSEREYHIALSRGSSPRYTQPRFFPCRTASGGGVPACCALGFPWPRWGSRC